MDSPLLAKAGMGHASWRALTGARRPMLQVFLSNKTERLVDRLALQLDVQRKLVDGPFSAARIIVPDDRVAAYLKLELTRRDGVLRPIECLSWLEVLEELLEAHPDHPLLIERRALRARLVEVLSDTNLLERSELAPVRRYLGDNKQQSSGAEDALERRRFQLADQLSNLFTNYAFTRPSLLDAWLGEERWFSQTVAAGAEAWQAILWKNVTARFTSPSVLTPRQVSGLFANEELSLGKMVHVFPFGEYSPVIYEIIEGISRHAVIFGYGLNPSQEFWGDIRFGRPEEEEKLFSSAGVAGGHLEYGGDDSFWSETEAPFLLRACGFAGAIHMRALETFPNCEVHPLYEDEDEPLTPWDVPDKMLHRMQHDLLNLTRTPLENLPGEEDRSIEVLAAPNIKREIEVIANEILALVDGEREDGGAPLAFHDIAVLLPASQREAYQTHIRAVFPTTQNIPYNMIDMPALEWSRGIEAVGMLLALPFGQFRRQELLRLLTHPNVIARFPHIDPRDWMRWCDELRILHGADRTDHEDTYIESELFHWEQGFRRLVLGAFMTGKPAGDRRAFELGGHHYLPHEYGQEDLPSAARLVLMARSMIEDAKFSRQARMPMRKWAEFFCRMVSTYIAPHDPGDELLLHSCRQLLAGMADRDPGTKEVSYRIAYEVAIDLLSELEVKRGQTFLEGVTVMGLEAKRSVPFKAIFIAGLGEGHYPQAESRRPEDLQFVTDARGEIVNAPGAQPDVGKRDRQKWTFLETLLCAREHLFLSYVARDPRTGEPCSPSAVINELLWAFEQDYVPLLPGETEDERSRRVEARWITRHELRRFHPRYFPGLLGEETTSLTSSRQPEAKREAMAKALREQLDEMRQQKGMIHPTRDELQYALPATVWKPLARQLGQLEPPPPEDLEDEEVLRLSTYELRAFLECPLQGSARFLLRLDEDDDDLLLKESELFETSGAPRMSLLRDVFLEKLAREHTERRPLDFGPVYDDRARYFELEGLVPTGPFYRAARQRNIKVLMTWQENLPKLGLGRSPRMEVRRFGRRREHEMVDVAMPPLVLDVPLKDRRLKVEISGKTESILPESAATLITHPTENAYGLSPKYFMRGFLDYVIMTARGEEQSRPWTVLINPAEEVLKYKRKNCERSFEPIEPETARSFLRDVITDMVTRVHAYYLPIEVAFQHIEKEMPVAQIAETVRHNPWKPTSADFGPIRDAGRFEPPEDAREIISKRYGLYFERVRKRGK